MQVQKSFFFYHFISFNLILCNKYEESSELFIQFNFSLAPKLQLKRNLEILIEIVDSIVVEFFDIF